MLIVLLNFKGFLYFVLKLNYYKHSSYSMDALVDLKALTPFAYSVKSLSPYGDPINIFKFSF